MTLIDLKKKNNFINKLFHKQNIKLEHLEKIVSKKYSFSFSIKISFKICSYVYPDIKYPDRQNTLNNSYY